MISESWTISYTPSSTFPPEQISKNSSECNYSLITGERSKPHFYGWLFVAPMAFILIVAILVTVFGNILVILTIWRHHGMRTRTNLFLANLALADILVGVLDMPLSVVTIIQGDWLFEDGLCKFNAFTNGLGLMTSTHTLMLISIHKYISITRPFSQIMSTGVICLMIGAAWLWSTIYNLAPFYGWTKVAYKTGATQCGPVMPCTMLERLHSYCNTLINLITPIVVMIFCNVRIFRAVGRHLTRMRQTSNMDFRNTVLQQRRITVTLVIVIACFFVCWTPYTVYSCMIALSKNHGWVPPILNPISYWCGFINSACNPVIYALRSPSFRQGYKEILFGHSSEGVSTGSFYSGTMNKSFRPNSQPNRRYFKNRSNKASVRGYSNTYLGRVRNAIPPKLLRENSAPAMFVDAIKAHKPVGKINGDSRHKIKSSQSSPNILAAYPHGANGNNCKGQFLTSEENAGKPWRSIQIPSISKTEDRIHGSLEDIGTRQKLKSNAEKIEMCSVTKLSDNIFKDDTKPSGQLLGPSLPLVTLTRNSASPDVEVGKEIPEESRSLREDSNLEELSLALGGSLEKLHRQITQRRLRRHGVHGKDANAENLSNKLLNPNDDALSNRSSKSIRSSIYSLFRKSTDIFSVQTKTSDEAQISVPKPNSSEYRD